MNMWEVWEGVIPSDYCERIKNRAQHVDPIDATIGFVNSTVDNNIRSSVIRWLNTYQEHSDVASTLMHYVKLSNRNNFGYDISVLNDLQYTEYYGEQNGKYDWHFDIDFDNPKPFDRKLSVVLQLSDPSDYEGGRFEFFGIPSPGDNFLTKGSLLVFPSFFHHRVLPVTKGKRVSLVSWVEGLSFR